jgi:hypothetical protein
VAGIIAGQRLFAYVVALLIPSLPALFEGYRIVNEHREVTDEEERVGGDILDLWERGLHEPTTATIDECRRLQDCNYIKRSRGPLVPD